MNELIAKFSWKLKKEALPIIYTEPDNNTFISLNQN